MARLGLDSTAIEDHEPLADACEVALYLEVFDRHVAGTNLLQENTKLGNVPLAIPQFIDEFVLCLLWLNPEGPVERPICHSHPQGVIENQDRFP